MALPLSVLKQPVAALAPGASEFASLAIAAMLLGLRVFNCP
jgi:hypothetical protein